MRVLLLGGTTEASELARRFAGDERFEVTLSFAGRTANPLALPVRTRSGGFGGIEGLASYIARESIELVVDATHPFAAQISMNAINACARTGTPLITLERMPWAQVPGDTWLHFADVTSAVAALPPEPLRVFSGLGRLSLEALRAAPQHHWVIRVIDPIAEPLGLSHATVVTARGPFKLGDDLALFNAHRIDAVLAKNSGGTAAYAKIEAANELGLPVYIIDRPMITERPVVRSVDEAWVQLVAHYPSLTKRGV